VTRFEKLAGSELQASPPAPAFFTCHFLVLKGNCSAKMDCFIAAQSFDLHRASCFVDVDAPPPFPPPSPIVSQLVRQPSKGNMNMIGADGG